MTTELKLTIDEEVAKKIAEVAKKQNTSVSQLTEDYFVELIKSEADVAKPSLLSLAGTLKLDDVSDEALEKIKEEHFRNKYGL